MGCLHLLQYLKKLSDSEVHPHQIDGDDIRWQSGGWAGMVATLTCLPPYTLKIHRNEKALYESDFIHNHHMDQVINRLLLNSEGKYQTKLN